VATQQRRRCRFNLRHYAPAAATQVIDLTTPHRRANASTVVDALVAQTSAVWFTKRDVQCITKRLARFTAPVQRALPLPRKQEGAQITGITWHRLGGQKSAPNSSLIATAGLRP
jgi:hypothetical protein